MEIKFNIEQAFKAPLLIDCVPITDVERQVKEFVPSSLLELSKICRAKAPLLLEVHNPAFLEYFGKIEVANIDGFNLTAGSHLLFDRQGVLQGNDIGIFLMNGHVELYKYSGVYGSGTLFNIDPEKKYQALDLNSPKMLYLGKYIGIYKENI